MLCTVGTIAALHRIRCTVVVAPPADAFGVFGVGGEFFCYGDWLGQMYAVPLL